MPGVGAPGVDADWLGERCLSPPAGIPVLVVVGSLGLREGLVELGFRPSEVALIRT